MRYILDTAHNRPVQNRIGTIYLRQRNLSGVDIRDTSSMSGIAITACMEVLLPHRSSVELDGDPDFV